MMVIHARFRVGAALLPILLGSAFHRAAATSQEPTIEALLEELDFTPLNVPAHRVEVSVGLFVKHLFYFNDKSHSFGMEVYLFKKWPDGRNYSRLFNAPGITDAKQCSSGAAERYIDLGQEASYFWHPELVIRNAVSTEVQYESTTLHEDGHFESFMMMKVEVNVESHDYHSFPFDQQHMELVVSPARSFASRTILRALDDVSGLDEEDALENWPAWKYEYHKVSVQEYSPKFGDVSGCSVPSASIFFFDVAVSRLSSFAVRVFINSYLLVVASWGPFYVNPQKLMPRVAMAFISLLTGVNWLASTAAAKPSTPYITWFDVWEASIWSMIATSLVAVVMAEYMNQTLSSSTTQQLDSFARKLFPATFLVLQLIIFLCLWAVSDPLLMALKYLVYANVPGMLGTLAAKAYMSHRRLWQQVLKDPFHHHRNAPPLDVNELSMIYKYLNKEKTGLIRTVEIRQWLTLCAQTHDCGVGSSSVGYLADLDASLEKKFTEFLNEMEFKKYYHEIINTVEEFLRKKADEAGTPEHFHGIAKAETMPAAPVDEDDN